MEITRAKEPLWAAVLDGQRVVEVQLVDTHEYLLCIFDSDSSELLYSEPAECRYRPMDGAHVDDVVRWMARADELVDGPDPPWNQTS